MIFKIDRVKLTKLFKGATHFSCQLIPAELLESLCLSTEIIGLEAGYTRDRAPVHHRGTKRPTVHTTMQTLIPKDNLESN